MIENSIIAIVPSFYLFTLGFFLLASIAMNNITDVLHAKADIEPPKDKYADSPEPNDDSNTRDVSNNKAGFSNTTVSDNIKTSEKIYVEKTGAYLIAGDESIPLPTNLKTFFKFSTLRTLSLYLKAKNHSVLAFFIDVARFFLWGGILFFSALSLIAFLSVTGTDVTQPVSYLGCVMIFISWIVKCVRRSNKRTYFPMRRKNNKSYLKFLRKVFKPAQLSTNASNYKNLTTLIPYSVLLGKEKSLQAMLPETHESVPDWINAPYEMSFKEIDNLIEAELNYERPIN